MPTIGGATYGGAPYAGPQVLGGNPFNNQFPLLITEISFSSNPLDDPAVWTDVSLWTRSVQTNRGRTHELNRFEAGTATIVLDNSDGRFSPFNGSSPYSPNVVPYRQIRVRALWNGIMYPLFRGHIEAWPVKWPSTVESTIQLSCVDAFKILNLKKAHQFSPAYQQTILADAPTALYMLNDQPGSTRALDSSGNANHGTVAIGGNPGPAFLGAPSMLTADASTSYDNGTKYYTNQPFTNGFLATPVSLNTNNDFSIEMWVNIRTLSGGALFFLAASGGTFSLSVDSTGVFKAQIQDAGGLHTIIAQPGSNQQLPTNTPLYFAVTWAHASSSLKLTMSGGVLLSSNTTAGFVNGSAYNNMKFGAFDGTMQAIAIWTTTDIQASSTIFPAYHYFAGTSPLFASKAFGSITAYQTTGVRMQTILTAIGWPASLTKVDAGLITCQTATNDLINQTALTNMQTTCDTELGELFMGADGSVVFYDHTHKYQSPNNLAAVTLGDSGATGPGGESPYLLDSLLISYDDLDIYNDVIVTPAGQGAQIAADATSQTAYGDRALSKSGVHELNNDAFNEANWLVGRYKIPLQRIESVALTPYSDPTVLWPAALGFDLLTRINVKRRPKDGAGSTFSQDSLIEGIEHNITSDSWQTNWRLSPTDASPLMGIFNQSTFNNCVFAF